MSTATLDDDLSIFVSGPMSCIRNEALGVEPFGSDSDDANFFLECEHRSGSCLVFSMSLSVQGLSSLDTPTSIFRNM